MSIYRDAVVKADLDTLRQAHSQGNIRSLKDIESVTGNTLLHDVAEAFEPGGSYPITESRRMEVVKFLVETVGIDIKTKNSRNETALDIANRKYGKNNLLSQYFGLREPTLAARYTPIQVEEKRHQLFDLINENKLDAFKEQLDALADDIDLGQLQDELGNTLLINAVKEKKRMFIIMLISSKRYKTNLNAANHEGKTAFDFVDDIGMETLLRNAENTD